MARLYINPTLEKQIRLYCEKNDIEDINAFANRCTLQGLNIMKYGISPLDNVSRENNGIKDTKKSNNLEKQEKNELVRKDEERQLESEISENTEEKEVKVKKIRVIKK